MFTRYAIYTVPYAEYMYGAMYCMCTEYGFCVSFILHMKNFMVEMSKELETCLEGIKSTCVCVLRWTGATV